MRLRIFLLLLFLILGLSMPQNLQGSRATTIPTLQLGYSPFKLYDAALGSPVYLPQESLWVYSPYAMTFALADPNGRRIVTRESAGSPLLLHRFVSSDPDGVWMLSSRSRSDEVTRLPIHFLKANLKPASFQQSFSLKPSFLTVSGSFTMTEEPKFPLSVVLARRGATNPTREITTNITMGFQNLLVTVDHDFEGQQILLTPHFARPIEGEEPVELAVSAKLWAELMFDIPLVRIVNPTSSVITFVKDVVTRTQKVRTTLGGDVNQTLVLRLPRQSSPLEAGELPLRYGRMEILLSVQIKDTIKLVKIPFYLIPTGDSFGIVGAKEFSPIKEISFSFTDDLVESATYDLLLISKVYGVDVLWNTTIAPPLARIYLRNELLQRLEADFSIIPKGDVETARIGNAAYVVVPRELILSGFEVVYGGVKLTGQDFSPSTLRLKPQSEGYIAIRAGFVAFDVRTSGGQTIDSGSVTLYRIINSREEVVKTVNLRETINVGLEDVAPELSSYGGPANLTLPAGSYRAEVKVGDQSQSKTFSVNKPSTRLEFIFEEATIQEESQPIPFVLAIIAVETIVAYWVWSRALRRLKAEAN